MKLTATILFFLFSQLCFGQNLVFGSIKKDTASKNILIIMFGESNSGGIALNSDAIPTELGVRGKLQLWNNTTNSGFYSLEVPVNSLVGHSGLEYGIGTRHGWELQIANRVYEGSFSNTDTVYVVKAGQGGSIISQWADGGGYWNTWKTRVNGAIANIEAKGKPLHIYVMFSLGINSSGVDPSGWYTAMLELVNRTRTEIGPVKFYMTYIPAVDMGRIAYNEKIKLLGANYNYIVPITTNDVGIFDDGMHWNYTGMKVICNRMLSYIISDYNSKN